MSEWVTPALVPQDDSAQEAQRYQFSGTVKGDGAFTKHRLAFKYT